MRVEKLCLDSIILHNLAFLVLVCEIYDFGHYLH